jgi:hypothetical protein
MTDSNIVEFKAKSNPLPHAKQPFMCPDCEAEIVKVAEAGRDGQHIQYCEENYVFAVVTVRMATILQYDLVGPILKSEAAKIADQYAAQYRELGLVASNRGDFN